MSTPTVYAVMTATIEIRVRPSSGSETLEQMYEASRKEAEDILRNQLPDGIKVTGPVTFLHAVVKGRQS